MKFNQTLCFALFFACCTFNAFSQNEISVQELVKLKFPPVGVEWEKPVTNKSVVIIGGGMGAGFAFSASSNGGSDFYYRLAPYAEVTLRNYYNIGKRAGKGRNTANNSANFFELRLTGYFPDVAASDEVEKSKSVSMALIPSWGMQRSLSKRVNFEWNVGGGIGINSFNRTGDSRVYFAPRLSFAFSYLLKK